MALFGIPSSIFGGDTPNVTAQAWVIGIELGLVWLAGAWILVTQLRSGEREPMTPFARIYPAAWFVVFAGALAGVTAGVPRRQGRHHQRRHPDRQRPLHDRLLRRRGRESCSSSTPAERPGSTP